MQEPQRLDPDELETEHSLSSLTPKRPPPRLSAQAVIYAARLRSQRLQLWTWRGIAAALALVLTLQFTPRYRPTSPVPMPTPQPEAVAANRSTAPRLDPLLLTGDDYISTRNRALALGVPVAVRSDSAPLPPLKGRSTAKPDLSQPPVSPSLLDLLPPFDAKVPS